MPTIRNVIVEGNSRISTSAILRYVSVKPQSQFDPAACQKDMQRLHALGIFEDLQVESREAGDGQVDVAYRVREHPFVSTFEITGVDSKLERQIHDFLKKEKLELIPAAPYKPAAATKAALAVRGFLRGRKYSNADVRVAAERKGNSVRVLLNVSRGPKLEIGAVRFTGNNSIASKHLLKQMKFARPTRYWEFWAGGARYIPEELQSDIQQIQLYYKSKGFAAVRIGAPKVQVTSTESKPRIEIEIPIIEGGRYRLTSVEMEGRTKSGAAEVERLVRAIPVPSDYDYSLLNSTRQKIVDTLGHHGYALADVEVHQLPNESDLTVQAIFKINAGDPLAIGRILFSGNKRLPDKFLRRELRAQEGEIFDTVKLDKSVEKLNKSNLIENLHRSDVHVDLNEETNLLDITFNIKEKAKQGIYATGGTGGINGGYMGILYTAFNFLRLGETLSVQLDGGAAQSNMLVNMVGTHFLGSPFTLALSVFNRYAGFNVASVVPGPESMVSVLRKRSRGVGLSGSYPVTGSLQVGMGFQAEQDSVTNLSSDAPPVRTLRSELAPFVLFDKTSGIGAETRGYRLGFSQALNGSLFLKSLDSTSASVQFTRYLDDPWSNGRNSFAFHFHGSWARPSGGGPLLVERRFYPGDESVRGFSRGSLSPWAEIPGEASPRAAGADSVLGFSTEYRVPLRGPLSSAGFFDLGWTRLDPREARELGSAARLIGASNGLVRASLGGELRLQLPIINQPARMIFSWNPLRLNTVVTRPSSILKLAEPKTSLRFALGTLY